MVPNNHEVSENDLLRQRIAELEKENRALREELQTIKQSVSSHPIETGIDYQALFEQSPVPMVIFDTNGLLVDINQKNADFLGVPREAVIQKFNLVTNQEAMESGHAEYFHRALDGKPVTMEPTAYNTERADISSETGATVWTETTYFPLSNSNVEVSHIVGLNVDVSHYKNIQQKLEMERRKLFAILDHMPAFIYIQGSDYHCHFANQHFREQFGDPKNHSCYELIFGRDTPCKVCPPFRIFQETETPVVWEFTALNGRTYEVYSYPFEESEGTLLVMEIGIDITERKQMNQQLIESQRNAIRELSSPLIPIADNIVIMPLIGTIDSTRAQQIMETLLEGVAHHQSEFAILDVTGVLVVDTQVANAIVQAAQAVRLLGAEVVLTGIGPAMAQTLVGLETDLAGIITQSTLQAGIQYVTKYTM